MKLFVRSALVALTLGALAAPLAAQQITQADEGPARKGFYIGLGLAGASVSADCETCNDADAAGMFGSHIKLGGTLSQSVRLGADLFGVRTDNGIASDLGFSSDATETAGHAMLAVTVYPVSTGNFWFTGGLGSVVYIADVDGDQQYVGRGFGGMLGVGWDLRVGRNGSISPYINLVSSANGKLYDEDGNEVTDGDKWQTAYLSLGVDYVFH